MARASKPEGEEGRGNLLRLPGNSQYYAEACTIGGLKHGRPARVAPVRCDAGRRRRLMWCRDPIVPLI